MPFPIEIATLRPRHHIGIGVRKQYQPIAFASQLLQGLQIALGNVFAIAQPGMAALIIGEFASAEFRQFPTEVLGSNLSLLQFSEDATLRIGVKPFIGIGKSQSLKTPECFGMAECHDNAPEVEYNITYHSLKISSLFFLASSSERSFSCSSLYSLRN